MNINEILDELNFIKKCRKYNLGIWQCPSFLFVMMGAINVIAMIGTYMIAKRYDNPEIVVASVAGVSIIIFIIGSSVIKGVEEVAKASMMKSEFVSIVSHQLKSPLTGMKWSLDLLLGKRIGEFNDKQRGYLKSTQENVLRMIRLVNDLLDVSRIESGGIKMVSRKVSLREVIESVAKELDFFAKANNTQIKLKAEDNLPKVFVDPMRIRMVVQNLVDNAIKYSNKRGVVGINVFKKNGFVCCHINDSGVGIPKKEQKKVFGKFFRSNNVIKKQTIGTGLGLYIAKAVIESSGGKIGFTSEEGKGSTFWFTLPAVSEANSK